MKSSLRAFEERDIQMDYLKNIIIKFVQFKEQRVTILSSCDCSLSFSILLFIAFLAAACASHKRSAKNPSKGPGKYLGSAAMIGFCTCL
jgi:hypothetical protein